MQRNELVCCRESQQRFEKFNAKHSTLATLRFVHIFNSSSWNRLADNPIMSRRKTLRNLAVVIPIVVLMVFVSSCKNESGTPPEEIFLSAPSVFVPVGLLKQPQGISVDASGNVWVADTRAGKVRRFSSEGVLRDSVTGFALPTRMGIDRSNNMLLLIDNLTINRINPQTGAATIVITLNGITVDGSSVFDVNSRSTGSTTVEVQHLGDIEGTVTGDIVVSAHGTPENFVVRIRGGTAGALVGSSLAPPNSAERGAHFLAVDDFGTVFTSFAISTPTPIIRVYSFSPSNASLSHVLSEPYVTGAARGAGMDASGNLYITDPAMQQLIVVSTLSERTIARYSIPDVGGYSMVPHDVAASSDGALYVVVTDRLGTEAGAVLKYLRNSR